MRKKIALYVKPGIPGFLSIVIISLIWTNAFGIDNETMWLTWKHDPDTSIVINWNTIAAESSYVDYGLTDSYGSTAEGVHDTTIHHVELTGLTANTTYHFRARGGSGQKQFPDRTHKTARAEGDTSSFKFVIYSDVQQVADSCMKAANGIGQEFQNNDVKFVFIPGDFAHPGAFDTTWFDLTFTWCDSFIWRVPILPIPGNHETDASWSGPAVYSDTALAKYREVFELPDNGSTDGREERYYSLNYQTIKMIALEKPGSTIDDDDWWDLSSEQGQWMQTELQNNDKLFTVVGFHEPIVGYGAYGYTENQDHDLIELWRDEGVDLIAQGHIHGYERCLYEDLTFTVSATGGAVFNKEPTYKQWTKAFRDSTVGYILAEVFPDSISFSWKYSDDGSTWEVYDQFGWLQGKRQGLAVSEQQ